MLFPTMFVVPGEVYGQEGQGRRPPVPRATDHVIPATKTSRNFLHWNALTQMRNAPPDLGEPKAVDDPSGNSQLVERAGLTQKFTYKKVRTKELRAFMFFIFMASFRH